ncbi:MAG TPA: ketopantoate reductase family protein [Caulobacteraceae bacterium]|nr:ketopantoate reductase family protein [Caulobacteraceae bacterium]
MSLKILIVGAGAVGGYFGARLAAAGRDVTFLVRPNRAAALRAQGLQVKSPLGDLTLQPKLVIAEDLSGPFQLIFLSVKAYALEAAMKDFAPAVGPNSLILPVLNGMAHMARLEARFGRDALIGGACRIAVTLQDGVIRQLMPLQQIGYGELDGAESERVRAVDAAMQGVGFDASISSTILPDMWEKWVQLASLGGANCLLRGSIGEIVAAPGGQATALAILQEAADVARSCGYPPSDRFMSTATTSLTQPGSPLASSMYGDLKGGTAVEVDAILQDLVDRGHANGVNTPLLRAAAAQLHLYQAARGSA